MSSHQQDAQPRAARRNVLFVSRQRLIGRTNGSSVYLLDLAEAVRAAGFVPHLIQPAPSILGRMPFVRLRPEMRVFETHAIRGVVRVGDRIFSRDLRVAAAAVRGVVCSLARRAGVTASWAKDRPMPYSIAMPWTEADCAFLRRKSRGIADIVIADYFFQAPAFECVAERPAATAIVMHDLFHARAGSGTGAAVIDSVASVDRATEIAQLARADAVIAIQAAEAEFITREVPGTQAILAPMAARPVASAQPGEAKRILFVGSNTAPNVVGLRWFFDECWPAIQDAWPEARLDVAGTVARAFPEGGPEGVTFHGLVDDLDGFYKRAGIVISPLTFGSGLKIKLVEALAQGKALVATSVTLQGVEDVCRGAVAHADAAPDFAAAVLGLRDDAARAAIAARALETAQRHFAAEACYGAFVEWLRSA